MNLLKVKKKRSPSEEGTIILENDLKKSSRASNTVCATKEIHLQSNSGLS